MITEPVGQVLVNVFYKPVAGNNNIEQEQRHKRDGDGEDPPLKEEIVQVEVIRKLSNASPSSPPPKISAALLPEALHKMQAYASFP